MNPVYSPVQPGAPYGNPKNMAYTGYPTGYPTAAPAYNPNMYPTSSPGYAPATLLMKQAWPQTSSSCATEGTFHLPVDTGTENRTYQASSAAFRYTAGTPYKVPPTQSNNAPPPYSPSPNPYQTAMYPIRSAYPQQNLYTQGAYYTQPVYAAQPHVIHHTTVVQPNSIPSAIYPAPVAAPRTNGVAMGMVAGTTMAMNLVDHPTTHRHRSTSSFCANVPGSRDPHLQLRTAALVNPLAKSYPKSNIVCNYTSLTSGLRPLDCSTSSVCKNKRKKCKGHFMHSLVVFVKAAFSNLLPLYFPSLLPLPDPHQSCNTY
uniref:Family with sequence similarity 168 member A n=1 Tax=Gallus gallus TaxID=9031 RepID=A0A8V0XDZ0_CHICK